MEGKLIKVENGYVLMVDNIMHATDNDKLSLKNCEAIENGYDLDELAVLSTKDETTIVGNQKMAQGFIKGFQKALEILGDKKFSEEDMKKVYLNSSKYEWFGDCIKSLQQTEWDVEIEMWFHGTRHKKGEWIPKLDADGCLILKRK